MTKSKPSQERCSWPDGAEPSTTAIIMSTLVASSNNALSPSQSVKGTTQRHGLPNGSQHSSPRRKHTAEACMPPHTARWLDSPTHKSMPLARTKKAEKAPDGAGRRACRTRAGTRPVPRYLNLTFWPYLTRSSHHPTSAYSLYIYGRRVDSSDHAVRNLGCRWVFLRPGIFLITSSLGTVSCLSYPS